MRRGIIAVALVTVLIMLVMVAPAFARQAQKSGGYWPYSSTLNAFVGYNGTDIMAGGTAKVSPHSGFAVTTGKCKVCHAVHGAGSMNATKTAMATTEVLLRTTKADSCSFCHLTGSFADNPYYNTTYGKTALQNYSSNTGFDVTGTDQYNRPRSGHSDAHGHDNYRSSTTDGYHGCSSCHAVHGANTMAWDDPATPAVDPVNTYILKNDPAKGVTSRVGQGWADTTDVTGDSMGYGSISAPTKTQVEFCQDCHDGTQVVKNDGTKQKIETYNDNTVTDFSRYFPGCGVNTVSTAVPAPLCHNSVEQDIQGTGGLLEQPARTITQFGVTYNTGHNGRSHIMTASAFVNADFAQMGTDQTGPNPLVSSANGCQTCHNVTPAAIASSQQNTFPHYTPGNELIPQFSQMTQGDKVCLRCHQNDGAWGVGVTF